MQFLQQLSSSLFGLTQTLTSVKKSLGQNFVRQLFEFSGNIELYEKRKEDLSYQNI